MRAIDADALNVTLDFYIAGCDLESKKDQTTLTIALGTKKIVDKMPTISPSANWTPCSVALPNDVEIKVVTLYYTNETQIAYFLDGQWYTTNDQYIDNEAILAWQKLPEPYRGEG